MILFVLFSYFQYIFIVQHHSIACVFGVASFSVCVCFFLITSILFCNGGRYSFVLGLCMYYFEYYFNTKLLYSIICYQYLRSAQSPINS